MTTRNFPEMRKAMTLAGTLLVLLTSFAWYARHVL